MTDPYDAQIAQAFKRLLQGLDAVDPDVLEADATADMITVVVPKTGEKVIINTQRAVHQVWVAGAGQGIHFSLDPATQRWLDDKGKGLELFTWVQSCIAVASGLTVAL
jgi:CyaY protein